MGGVYHLCLPLVPAEGHPAGRPSCRAPWEGLPSQEGQPAKEQEKEAKKEPAEERDGGRAGSPGAGRMGFQSVAGPAGGLEVPCPEGRLGQRGAQITRG